MPNGKPPEDRPSARFSNADGDAWWRSPGQAEPGKPTPSPPDAPDVPLAGLVEQIMRERFLNVEANPGEAALEADAEVREAAEMPPRKLFEELSAAREQLQARPAAPPLEPPSEAAVAAVPEARPAEIALPRLPGSHPVQGAAISAGAALRGHADASLKGLHRLSRRMRLRDWMRRYLTLVSLTHRHVFDRSIERLLFIKTTGPSVHSAGEEEGTKTFVYQGPIPGKVLSWALSALPTDLRRFAFVDFRAGNGRALLLAARRNFEHAAGYAFDTESCEVLEMNLAQYPRSYMSCRDVRALRGDRDGVAIPPQPVVLFFPDSLPPGHPGFILNHVMDSLRANPRPVYLIFENAGRESELDQMQFFERVPLPTFNRLKALLFSPSAISVYKSASGEGSG